MHCLCLCLILLCATSFESTLAASLEQPSTEAGDDVLFDQRQNGTENVRIHMNDVTVVVAPSEGLLQLLSSSGSSDFLNFGGTNGHHLPTNEFSTNISGEQGKPTLDCDSLGKCRNAQQTPTKKNRFRLSNILMPLLNRVHHSN